MLPKGEVGADFVEAVPRGDQLVLAVGDAPGTGLKGGFVARFVGNLFRRLVKQAGALQLAELLTELNRELSAHDYFEAVSMQCVALDPRGGILAVANAGCPYPVLYSSRRGRCDRLPVRGEVICSPLQDPHAPPRYEQRRVEMGPGDVLVLLSDGLIEGHARRAEGYGYRFLPLVEQNASRGARAVGEAILDAWRAHPRPGTYADDVTVVVMAVPLGEPAATQEVRR
jgi:serine phosphatase RsbU (regulator of sigma subunit)